MRTVYGDSKIVVNDTESLFLLSIGVEIQINKCLISFPFVHKINCLIKNLTCCYMHNTKLRMEDLFYQVHTVIDLLNATNVLSWLFWQSIEGWIANNLSISATIKPFTIGDYTRPCRTHMKILWLKQNKKLFNLKYFSLNLTKRIVSRISKAEMIILECW